MGFFTKVICPICGIEKDVWQPDNRSANTICDSCFGIIEKKRKDEHFKKLSEMSIENRIKRIEGILYRKRFE